MQAHSEHPPAGLQGRRWFRATNAIASLLLAAAFIWKSTAGREGAPPAVVALLLAGAVVAIVCNAALLAEWARRRRRHGHRRP